MNDDRISMAYWTYVRSISYEERALLYDIEFSDVPEIEFVSSLLRKRNVSILEAPCGCGRLTLPLARMARRVVAVDIEPAMIARLCQRMENQPASGEVETLVGDIRNLRISERFPIIICPQEAFQLFVEERDARPVLETFANHVTPNGCVLLDLATFSDRDRISRGVHPTYYCPSLPDDQIMRDWERRTKSGMLTRFHSQRVGRDVVTINFYYHHRRFDKPGDDEFRTTVSLRVYSPGEVDRMLHGVGFRDVQMYGDYLRTPFYTGAARLIVVARA